MKRKQKFYACGGLLLAAALCLTVYNLWDAHRAADGSEKILKEMEASASQSVRDKPRFVRNGPESAEIGAEPEQGKSETTENGPAKSKLRHVKINSEQGQRESSLSEIGAESGNLKRESMEDGKAPAKQDPGPGETKKESLSAYMRNPEIPMPEVEYEGRTYIGVLNIPALKLELPVISQWSYPSLKIAPCRYEGSAYLNNLVIAAHNYAAHFGKLKKLSPGDGVSFTDMDGNVFRYQVEAIETLAPTAIEEMTSGEYDLTLFTCTPGGKCRLTVRCKMEETCPAGD